MSETSESPFTKLDPDKPTFMLALGTKGSGKSVFAGRMYRSYPHDKIVIDPTLDAKPLAGDDVEDISHPLPGRMPGAGLDDRKRNLCFQPSMRDPDVQRKMDDAINLALRPKDSPALVWIDEVALLSRKKLHLPSTDELLVSGRHFGTSVIACGPRPVWIDKLWKQQADLIAIYNLPDEDDRDDVASVIGWGRRKDEFSDICTETHRRHPHAFLLWLKSESPTLYRMPPLPLGRRHDPGANSSHSGDMTEIS